jgi:hypothetical protein
VHRWETDATVSWQFGAIYGRATQTPEKRLLAALLMDALLQFEKVQRSRDRRDAQALHELRAWFYAADENWPFSFENVCAHLNLEPDAIRARLARVGQARRTRMHPSHIDK